MSNKEFSSTKDEFLVAASPSSAKRALHAQGMTLKQFAAHHGFKYRTVSEVIRGVNKGCYGEGHRVAVALGVMVRAGGEPARVPS